ncbi:MAG: PadR family transcriptional regulator [Candidatus Aminicenantes bacterium]|nr:PadR family transcriptional regulator [Candidatus Aminicenantes bacterium]MCK5004623.1 PadR family transcriptional regulator [Candidatus Aminicenantes bacterium]
MENKIKQLRKGVFELVILQVLKKDKYYGYSLIKAITDNCSFDINEGTIYPILSRLAKEELISSQWVESSKGPPRKYYMITHQGNEILKGLGKEFKDLTALVSKTKTMKKKGGRKSISEKKKIYPAREVKNGE